MYNDELIEIDGSVLEGGGQILRIAATLSVLTQIPLRVINIRAGRNKPGLMEQHLKGLILVSKLCRGKLIGAELGSTRIELRPGKIRGGQYFAGVKTAGSISLLLQVALPCLLFADSDTTLTLEGGTNADMAPQIDYTTEVFKPILEKFGATFDFDLLRRGYFPRGGGKVIVHVKPVKQLKALQMLHLGEIIRIYGWSYAAGNVPIQLAHTIADSACNALVIYGHANIERYKEDPKIASDNSLGIILVAESNTGCLLGGSAIGRSGKYREDPNETGKRAANELINSILQGACVDEHSQDQMIILMAIAQGVSEIRVAEITLHTKTAIYVIEKMTKVKFEIIENQDYSIIKCSGMGIKSCF